MAAPSLGAASFSDVEPADLHADVPDDDWLEANRDSLGKCSTCAPTYAAHGTMNP